MRGKRLVAVAAAAVTVGAGAAYAAQDVSTATVGVSLKEFKLIPVPKTVASGKTTFAVKNTGKLPHEFVVIKTKLPPGKLPTKGAKAVETGRVARLASVPAGQSRKLTVSLTSGKYALICNLPGHYLAGQWSGFTVG